MTAAGGGLLELRDVGRSFGSVRAVDGVSTTVQPAEIRGLIGPNGAGKTTLVNVVTGFVPASSGSVVFAGERLDGRPPHQRVRCGMSRTFQTSQLSQRMTVGENLLVGAHTRFVCSRFRDAGRLLRERGRMRTLRDRATSIAQRLGLAAVYDSPAGALAYGPLRLLEIGRALMTEPRLMLLDEPVAGMNTSESNHLAGILRGLRDEGVAVVVIEHDMSFVMGLCDQLTVLHQGRVLAEGPPRDMQENEDVAEVYLGTGATAGGSP